MPSVKKVSEYDGIVKDQWARQEVKELTSELSHVVCALGRSYLSFRSNFKPEAPSQVDARLEALEKHIHELTATQEALLDHLGLETMDLKARRVLKKKARG